METIDIILSVSGAVILLLVSIIGFLLSKKLGQVDDHADQIGKICETISAVSARQDGQISFAQTLINHHEKIAIIETKVDALHKRFDTLLDKLRLL